MTLDQLRYALELQRFRNFSRAAEACHITQPSLSVQIAKLEEEVGLSLFDRSRAKVEVTEYGEQFLKQARLVLVETARLSEIADELKGEVQGGFRLGIIPTLAPALLPLFLGEFGRHYPKVKLAITEESTERLIHHISHGAIDGAILSTPTRCPEALIEKPLFYEPFVVFASTGHAILKHHRVGNDQLSSSTILLMDDTHCLRDQVLQLCRSRQTESDQRLRIHSGSLQTLVELIRREEGYTLLPALSVRFLNKDEQKNNIRNLEKSVAARKVSLVFSKSRLKRSIIEALKEQICAQLPDGVFLTTSARDFRIISPGPEHFEL